MGRLKDKVAILTGGAKGLGREFATAMAAEGANVIIADIDDGTHVADQIGGAFIAADVSEPASAQSILDFTLQRFGPPDVLVNNAAIYATLELQRYSQISPDVWDRVMAVNVKGAFNMVQAVGPHMEARGRGKIINVTSGTVYKGMPNMLHYIASKGALTSMTRALSRELGSSGVCVNSLAPGLTLSTSVLQHPERLEQAQAKVVASRAIQRDAYPQDLVGALIFLASSDSDFVTGQTLVVDGGSVNT